MGKPSNQEYAMVRAAGGPTFVNPAQHLMTITKYMKKLSPDEASNVNGRACICGHYQVRAACKHVYERQYLVKCGRKVSEKRSDPVFCERPAPHVVLVDLVSTAQCKACRRAQFRAASIASTASTASTASAGEEERGRGEV